MDTCRKKAPTFRVYGLHWELLTYYTSEMDAGFGLELGPPHKKKRLCSYGDFFLPKIETRNIVDQAVFQTKIWTL